MPQSLNKKGGNLSLVSIPGDIVSGVEKQQRQAEEPVIPGASPLHAVE
ncbi:hypothetical protein SD77_4369 [Bacillus badius]|uniref:Uncharacterized protein n=1 Tax=Bacillus badius TaxID=1455 RepID=A0ABR5AVE8_BACBA|nr:hypothetical protein SD78_0674 [Bacillus badius]KIL78689.1 hypothetical protein SD77_4369 [Bacillus badius]